jgi:spore coat protein U-like protein
MGSRLDCGRKKNPSNPGTTPMNATHRTQSAAMLATGLLATSAASAITTDTFDVKITITNECNISTAPSDIDFGSNSSQAAADITATGSFAVNCTPEAPYTMGLNGGDTGDVNAREMTNGTETIGYQLYKDASHTTAWGLVDTARLGGTGIGSPVTHTVYGLVPFGANLNVPAGAYEDTITLDVEF